RTARTCAKGFDRSWRSGARRSREGSNAVGRGPHSRHWRCSMTQDDRPLGDVANKLLFENELVRVWEMHLAPGERSDRHRHDLPYLMCVLEGSRIDAEVEGQGRLELPVQPGSLFFNDPAATE